LFLGTIIVGVSSDEPADTFYTEARNVMLATTGVDLRSLGYRWKFVFTAEISRPEKAQYILRDSSAPYFVSMDVLIRGWFSKIMHMPLRIRVLKAIFVAVISFRQRRVAKWSNTKIVSDIITKSIRSFSMNANEFLTQFSSVLVGCSRTSQSEPLNSF